jgi:hypothetical protein
MKYFIDTEFLEGTQDKTIFGIKYGETKPTIDLISIGIVAEDGREYYAISKDFNLKEAWNRYDIKSYSGKGGIGENTHEKVYWIRDNVLKPIFYEMYGKDINFHNIDNYFTYKEFKKFINKYGKSNKQIAEEILRFISTSECRMVEKYGDKPEFYGYYSDYDWVVFCWLFGRMIDLPNGFPMFAFDLKQELDDVNKERQKQSRTFDIKKHPNYPNQTNEHNALADAKWNKKLYKFLNMVKPKFKQ